MTIVLGIETSCDETAIAVVDNNKTILYNDVFTQADAHKYYSGVVPELAARLHLDKLRIMLKRLSENIDFKKLDCIAVTSGPGLIGGLIIGVMIAKSIASFHKKKLIGINHLEGHALAVRLENEVNFPFLLLLLSGGHSEIIIVYEIGIYKRLGSTIDDALGEAFDKVACMLNLCYPGGPIIEKLSQAGNQDRFFFPRPLFKKKNCNFSFSGLKTAIKYLINSLTELDDNVIADICASFQKCIVDVLLDRLESAWKLHNNELQHCSSLVISGGVAANRYILYHIRQFADQHNLDCLTPSIPLCTDNAAMIAWAGLERYRLNMFDDLYLKPKARWPL